MAKCRWLRDVGWKAVDEVEEESTDTERANSDERFDELMRMSCLGKTTETECSEDCVSCLHANEAVPAVEGNGIDHAACEETAVRC